MTTSQYVKKFLLDKETTANHFNTNLFLEDLGTEFRERIQITIALRKKGQLEFTFHIFQVIIQEMQKKFSAISNKKAGAPLKEELWNAFYAKYVIPARAEYFPKEHEEIQARRNARLQKGEKDQG